MSYKVTGLIADPTLYDILLQFKKNIMTSINCIQIGTIESYNPLTNTASVSINFKRKLKNGDILEYPILGDCPVFVLTGGTASITMPIDEGDTCLILFNDRNINNWFSTGDVMEPSNNRCHDISDGIVLVGIKSLLDVSIPLKTGICIDGGSKKISIINDVDSIKTQLDAFIDSVTDVIASMSDTISKISATLEQIGATVDLFTSLAIVAPPGTAGGPCTITAPLPTDMAAIKTELTGIDGELTGIDGDLTGYTSDLSAVKLAIGTVLE